MTTNKEALQKIFDAALKEPEPQPTPTTRMHSRPPTESYPRPRSYGGNAAVATPRHATQTVSDDQPVRRDAAIFEPPARQAIKVEADTTTAISARATTHAANDIVTAELSSTTDRITVRKKNRRNMRLLLISLFAVGGIGGGMIWFIQSPEQGASTQTVISDIHAATKTQSIADEGAQSLDEAVALTNKADQAFSTLNISRELAAEENVGTPEASPIPPDSETEEE